MDWVFTDVLDNNGQTYRVACFAMICHNCGQRCIEFLPNARRENLFIEMIHAVQYMGIPRFVLTDNMKSIVLRRVMSTGRTLDTTLSLFKALQLFPLKFPVWVTIWVKTREEK